MPSSEELLRDAIAEARRPEEDDDAYWAAVHRLWSGDPADVWERIAPLASDADPRLRALVPDVLRRLGGTARPFSEPSVARFREMLRGETAPLVLAAIGHALGEMAHPAGVELMLPLATHAAAARLDDPHEDTRREAVIGLALRNDPRAGGREPGQTKG